MMARTICSSGSNVSHSAANAGSCCFFSIASFRLIIVSTRSFHRFVSSSRAAGSSSSPANARYGLSAHEKTVACETAGVPDVSYNGSTQAACPNTYLVSSRIDWAPYYKYAISAAMNGEAIDADWTGTLATGSVVLTELNENVVAAGTAEAVEAAKAELEAGTRHVYDVTTFTVDGQQLTSSMADVDTDADYTPDTEAIVDGYFAESTFRSAPYFQLNIDGITLLDTAF